MNQTVEKQLKSITITQALSELKMLDLRINGLIAELTPTAMSTGKDGIVNGFKTNEEFDKHTKAKWDSLNDLIKNRDSIKAGIVHSNATTKVKIGSDELTVASAIERKHSIEYRKTLLSRLKGTSRSINQQFEKAEQTLASKASDILNNSNVGEGDVAENYKKAQLDLITEVYKPKLHDPLDVKTAIEKLDNEITEFETNVDYALSVSNATTYIDV